MRPINVLIVDDSALIRKILTGILSETPDIKVVDTAAAVPEAREKIKLHNPDVVTLDVEMPGMDGLSFLEKIMTLRPTPVIMVSTLTQKGADAALHALELGAVDYIGKPSGTLTGGIEHFKEEFVAKIRTAATANLSLRQRATPAKPRVLSFTPRDNRLRNIIAIGSSTGGVEALRDIFLTLPANCPPIVMAQHMPQHFTSSFAARLDSLSQVTVAEATHGARLEAGHAYLAPGGRHLRIAKSGGEFICQLGDDAPVSGHRPSVDVLFESVAKNVGGMAVGIILTGMGKDGAHGLLHMREQGSHTIGQNQSTCVVYGMPKVANSIGAVAEELPLSEIATHALSHCTGERSGRHAS